MVNRVPQRLRPLVVFLVYCILTVIMMWPVVARLGSDIAGGDGDAWEHLWTFRWVRDSLLAGHSPFYTNLIFHPHGVSLANQNIAWFNIALWLPLQAIIGEEAGYSVAFMLIKPFNGFAVYLLARETTRSEPGAFLAGLIAVFWPAILTHYSQPNLILIFWVPMAMLYFKRTVERQRVSDALITAVFVALIGIARWQMLVIGGVLIVCYIVYLLLASPRERTAKSLKLILLVGIVALLLMLPLLMPILASHLGNEDTGRLFAQDVKSSDLLLFVRPNSSNLLWGRPMISQLFDQVQGNFMFYIGLTTLILAVYGIFTHFHQTRFWLTISLLYMIFALGPSLVINGRTFIPLPYRWLYRIPIFGLIGNPDRYVVILAIPIAILAAFGLKAILQKVQRPLFAMGIVMIFSGAILFEYYLEFPTLSSEIPAWYYQLEKEEGDFAILDLPVRTRLHDEFYMHYQSAHGKSLVGGKVSRPPSNVFRFIDSIPMLEKTNGANRPPVHVTRVREQFETLEKANVRYLIFHKDRIDYEVLDAWRSWLDLAPAYEDEDLVVYNTSWEVGRDTPLIETDIPGLGIVSASLTPNGAALDAWNDVKIRWGTQTGLQEDYDICLEMVNEAGDSQGSNCQAVSPKRPTHQWGSNEVVDVIYPMNTDTPIQAGSYELRATILPANDAIVSESSFLVDRLQINTSDILHARWADLISLPGHEIAISDNWLLLTLYWRAEQPIDASYKVFVHVIDEATGEIKVQDDAEPRDWSYPTNEWAPGELVDDTIILSLDGLPASDYRLQIGLYDPSTGQRLVAYSAEGERYSDDIVKLTTFQRQ